MIEGKRIAQTLIPDTLTTVYTVPAEKTLIVRNMTVCNLTGIAKTVDIVVLPSGESISNQHYYIKNMAIDGNTTKVFDTRLVLESEDALQIKASETGALSFHAFGGEYSPYITQASEWDAKEDWLGNPSEDGYVLVSTTEGVRSWVEMVATSNSGNLDGGTSTSVYTLEQILDCGGSDD
jgi:hypothetical protein